MFSNPTLGYALNVFPYEDVCGMMEVLRLDAAVIQRGAFANRRFPIELRFSQQIVDALRDQPRLLNTIRSLLRRNRLRLITINAFVPLSFHKGRVKERVYLPAWSSPRRDRRSRVAFTKDSIQLLAELMDDVTPFGSVSVPAGVLKKNVPRNHIRGTSCAIAQAIAECADFAFAVEAQTGRRVVIGLEPEPGLTCETTAETIDFFENYLWKVLPLQLQKYVGVNFDVCHQLVEWEDPLQSLRQLRRHRIPIPKIHVSNAIQLDKPCEISSVEPVQKLRRFYARSKYLHQTIAVNASGQIVFSSLDLPQVLTRRGLSELRRRRAEKMRIHYHMPLFESSDSSVRTTLDDVKRFLGQWRGEVERTPSVSEIPLIIETYTWLEQIRNNTASQSSLLRGNIIKEIEVVRRYLENW